MMILQSRSCWLLSIFLLVGCAGATRVEHLSANTFEIHYTESKGLSSPALVQNYMNEEAMNRCPAGYDKLRDRTIKVEYMPTHIWKIRCAL
jgi:hypothetical protein